MAALERRYMTQLVYVGCFQSLKQSSFFDNLFHNSDVILMMMMMGPLIGWMLLPLTTFYKLIKGKKYPGGGHLYVEPVVWMGLDEKEFNCTKPFIQPQINSDRVGFDIVYCFILFIGN